MGRRSSRRAGHQIDWKFFAIEELETRTLMSGVGVAAPPRSIGTGGVGAPITLTTPITYIVLDSSGANIDIYSAASPTGTPIVIPTESVTSIAVAPATGNDLLVVDYRNGDPVPSGGISYTGGGSSLGDSLRVIGASSTDPFVLGSGQVQHGAGTVTYSHVLNVTVTAGSATVTADLQLLGVTVGAQASLIAMTSQHVGQFTVNSGGSATLQSLSGAMIANGSLQFSPDGTNTATNSLNNLLLAGSTDNWTGRVDLSNNPLIVETTATNKNALLATLRNEVAYGMTHNAGILSTNLPPRAVLTVIDAATTGLTSFGGTTIDQNAILVVPEIPGDANIDGTVDQADLAVVMANFGTRTPNWTSGNFDNAGTIDLTDLAAVFNNFGATLATTPAAAVGTGGVSAVADAPTTETGGVTAAVSAPAVETVGITAVVSSPAVETGGVTTVVSAPVVETGGIATVASAPTVATGDLPTVVSASVTTSAGKLSDSGTPTVKHRTNKLSGGAAWRHGRAWTTHGEQVLKLVTTGD